jgi:hypothetical protein
MAKKFKHADLIKEINLFMGDKKDMVIELATNRYVGGENTLNLVADSKKKDYPVDIAEATITYNKEGNVIGYTKFSSPTFPNHDHFDKEHIKTIMIELHMLNMFLHYLLGEPKPPLKRVGEK